MPVAVAAALAAELTLATALDATELIDASTLDAAEAAEEVNEFDKTADPVVDDAVDVAVLFAQVAAVGRFVTPAGTQMLSAYLIVVS